jgi:hypothetical protein
VTVINHLILYQLQKGFSPKEYMRWITHDKIGHEGTRRFQTIVGYYAGIHLEGTRKIVENLCINSLLKVGLN